jgi:hypothetical protein
MSFLSLRIVDIPAQWDVRNTKGGLSIRERNYERGSDCDWNCFQGGGRRFRGCAILTTVCLQKDVFLTGKEDSEIDRGAHIGILSQLWWGKLYVWLVIYHHLVWDRIL